jgi:hypothetical protein
MPKGEDTRNHGARIVNLDAFRKRKKAETSTLNKLADKIFPSSKGYDPMAQPTWYGDDE